MEKIREKPVQHYSHRKDQIESIKARTAELDEYKIELDIIYEEL